MQINGLVSIWWETGLYDIFRHIANSCRLVKNVYSLSFGRSLKLFFVSGKTENEWVRVHSSKNVLKIILLEIIATNSPTLVSEYFWNVKKVNNDRSPLMDILYFGWLIVYLRFVFGCYQLDHFLFCSYSVVSKLPEAVYTWNFITNKTLLQVFSFKFYEIVQNNLVNRSSHQRWSI